jgi:acetyltransferase-like isoleucine patch superfamily enzyme
MIIEILVEQINVSDSQYKLVELFVNSGDEIKEDDLILSYESSKAISDYEATENGFVYFNPQMQIDEFYDVGYKMGIISDKRLEHSILSEIFGFSKNESPIKKENNITKKALRLINTNNLDISIFENSMFVTEKHVEDYLSKQNSSKIDFIEVKEHEKKLNDLKKLLDYGRKKMRAKFNRHVPTGNILNDRKELAKNFNWGDNSSVYDDCLIFGNVKLGLNCWVGPFTVLDGNAFPIEIGDWTSIGTGTHVYTHHTIDQALSGGILKPTTAPVSLGKNCFISPQVMIAPGTKIGDCCFVTAQSYVEGSFPDFSIVSGNPAKVIGKIEIDGNKIKKIFF